MSCLLCLSNLNPDDIIFSNEFCLFLHRPFSNLSGAGLILPKKHKETLFDLSSKELASTFALLNTVKQHIDNLHHPQGYTIGWDCGKVAGQVIQHAHLHILPRYSTEIFKEKGLTYLFEKDENRPQGSKDESDEKEFLQSLNEFLT